MQTRLDDLIDTLTYPLGDDEFRAAAKRKLDQAGVLALPAFIRPEAIAAIKEEGARSRRLAFYASSRHNIYLSPPDPSFDANHPRNRQIVSSKGCITTDQIADDSPLKRLYRSHEFREFLCAVLGESALHEYADPLSSINLHYAGPGQELGWHFDNSSFAITLMIEPASSGGVFEYVKDVRDADRGVENFERVGHALDGAVKPETLSLGAGALVLFRGRNSMHRVTPVEGDVTRMLAVLAYNSKPGVALSESARMTFYGRR